MLPGLPQEVPGDLGHPECGHKSCRAVCSSLARTEHAARSTPDGVPFIIKKCIFEIEQRALRTKVSHRRHSGGDSSRGLQGERRWAPANCRLPQGIYRVNGVKTRVEAMPGLRNGRSWWN